MNIGNGMESWLLEIAFGVYWWRTRGALRLHRAGDSGVCIMRNMEIV